MINKFIFEERLQPFGQHLGNSFSQLILTPRTVTQFKLDGKRLRNKAIQPQQLIKPQGTVRDQDCYAIYIENYFKGVKDEDYLDAITRQVFHQQKLKCIQEVDQQPFERKNIFQEKEREQPIMKIEISGEGVCQKCQATNVQLYEIDKGLCEECAFQDYPDQMSKYKLQTIITKKEMKGAKYEAKLKKFFEKKLKEERQTNQVYLNRKQTNENE